MTLSKESGFTLIEVLVTMAIFGIILGGILKVYDTHNYTYKVQEEVVTMNQNIRVGKTFLERDVRMAGCGIGGRFGFGGVTKYAIENDDDYLGTGSDSLTIRYINYEAVACADANPCSDLPTLTLNNNMPFNSVLANVADELNASAWLGDCSCNGTNYTQPNMLFPAIITDPVGGQSEIVIISGAQDNVPVGADTLSNAANSSFNGTSWPNTAITEHDAGSSISFLNIDSYTTVTYRLDSGALVRETLDEINNVTSTDPIAEDIEDLQFAFGLDRDGDGAFELPWVDGDLTDDEKSQVRLVRINVLGSTATEHRGYTNTRPALENNPAAGVSDGFRRKSLTVTVKVRNMGL